MTDSRRAPSAQQSLHWGRLSVDAHLNADGSLSIAEVHSMVFTGNWNVGERVFNLRLGQRLRFDGLARWTDGGWQPLREDRTLGAVDTFPFPTSTTLRWRARLSSDPLFADTRISYQLRYTLSGILQRDAGGSTLAHDFAFPDRPGPIEQLDVRLTLDPGWQPLQSLDPQYVATVLPPDRSFVPTVPMRHAGTRTAAAVTSPAVPSPSPVLLRARAEASSELQPWRGYTFWASNLLDGDVATSWQPASRTAINETVTFDFGDPHQVSSVEIANGLQRVDALGDLFASNRRLRLIALTFDDGSVVQMDFPPNARGFLRRDVGLHVTRRVVLPVLGFHEGARWPDLAVSEVRFLGQ